MNPYKDLYPNADWTYTYTCPKCNEAVPLEIDPDSPPFARQLVGHCAVCHLDIDILEEDYYEEEGGGYE